MLSSLALCTLASLSSVRASPLVAREMRVRLKRALPSVALSGFGLRVTPPSRLVTVSLPPLTTVRARVRAPERGRWLIEYDHQAPQEIQSERLWVRGQMMHVGAEAAPFDLELTAQPGGGIDVVARLDLEDYLLGVLPAEMPLSWPLQALKAQAVAARSFAWTMAQERRRRHFDVDSTIMDQVYRFAIRGEDRPGWMNKLRRAIVETRGEMLTDPHGHVLKAFYSADCGCVTEDPAYVWGPIEGFESVRDPTCVQRKPIAWHHVFTRTEVIKRLSSGLKLAKPTTLDSLLVGARTPSGRVASVVAVVHQGERRDRLDLNVGAFRRVFGYRRIRSSEFSLNWMGDSLKVEGVGLGHGVGMCQTGAKVMAERGANYRSILKLYYPRADLQRRPAI